MSLNKLIQPVNFLRPELPASAMYPVEMKSQAFRLCPCGAQIPPQYRGCSKCRQADFAYDAMDLEPAIH